MQNKAEVGQRCRAEPDLCEWGLWRHGGGRDVCSKLQSLGHGVVLGRGLVGVQRAQDGLLAVQRPGSPEQGGGAVLPDPVWGCVGQAQQLPVAQHQLSQDCC